MKQKKRLLKKGDYTTISNWTKRNWKRMSALLYWFLCFKVAFSKYYHPEAYSTTNVSTIETDVLHIIRLVVKQSPRTRCKYLRSLQNKYRNTSKAIYQAHQWLVWCRTNSQTMENFKVILLIKKGGPKSLKLLPPFYSLQTTHMWAS